MDRGLNILYCSYRDWGESLFYKVKHVSQHNSGKANFKYISTDQELKNENIEKFDLIFFVGWSTIVPENIVNNKPCVCLHPSPLPKYRGGSPIQNQIMNGEKNSAVTLFLMNSKLDAGDILRQVEFSLDGNLEEIFSRIQNVSYLQIVSIIEEYEKNGIFISRKKQNEDESTFYKRRKKEMSEIHLNDFENFTAEEIYNKIRCLQDPYPNAFIKCKNNTLLYITKAKI